ncbi:MAG: hypothetical protein R3B07_01785 [Polyangiaceae bacterium]
MLETSRRVSCFVVCAALSAACGQVVSDGPGGDGGTAGSSGGNAGSAQGGDGFGGGQAGSSFGGMAQGGSSNGGSGDGGSSFGGSSAGTASGGNAGTGQAGTSWGGVGGVAGSVSVVGEGFVVQSMELGERDPSGAPNSSAWKSLGTDIDGLTSDQNSTNHCQLQPGSNPSAVKTDGVDGIDNSFGANILPLLLGIEPTVTIDLQTSIDRGQSIGIVTSPNLLGSDVSGSIGRANTRGTGYNLSDPWWMYENGYPDGTPRCELAGGTFQGRLELSGSGFWELHLPIAGADLVIKVRKTQLLADIDATTSQLSNVMLAGVIRTEELVEAFRQVAGALDLSLCDGSTFDSIAGQLRAASDIRDDGQNGDPTLPCNGISIGMSVELDPMLFYGYDPGDTPPISCF